MSESLDGQLLLATEKVRRKKKLEGMLREAQGMLHDSRERMEEHSARLAREQGDVEKLEGMTLTAMFYSMLGTREDRLSKEQQELVAAKLKYEEARKMVAANERSCQEYRGLLAELGNIESEFGELLEKKRSLLRQEGGPQAGELANLEQEIALREGQAKELKEAIQAGASAIDALDMVRSSLSSARNWGTWDMMGGGMLVTMAKHSQLDDARRRSVMAQEKLRRFRTELAEAGERLHVSLEIGSFTKFADYFFDGLIADWIVQSDIHRATDVCHDAIGQVRDAVRECRRKLEETTQEGARFLEVRKRVILEG
jgi:hypothetical protein